MTHVYLNESVIKEALKAKTITKREAQELTIALKKQRPLRTRNRRTPS